MDRTIRVQLKPTPEQAQALHETLTQFTLAFNAVCDYGWQHQQKNGVALHHATYYETKTLCPRLVSDLLIQARVKATEAVKSALTWKVKHEQAYPKKVAKAEKRGTPLPPFKPVRCPRSALCPVRYNEKTYVLNWQAQSVRLSTTQGRMTLPFAVAAYHARYQGSPPSTADLIYRKGQFYLHIVVSVSEPAFNRTETVIGIDLGLNRPAVTSHRQFLGQRRWKAIDRRSFRMRRKLQSKGTKSAKRHLRKVSRKQARFHRDCDHVLAKRIVQDTAPGSTLVLENLRGIRDSSQIGRGKKNKNVDNKRRLHSWTFAQLYLFIRYKAQERGIEVSRIDPRHTSQTCSKCGYHHRSNRRSQSLFRCRSCGYCLNADLNASYNIRDKYLASLANVGTPSLAGFPVSEPIVSD